MTDKVNGYPVIGFIETETQDGVSCGYILVWSGHDWITAWWRTGDTQWCNGHYHEDDMEGALADFTKRASTYLANRSVLVKEQ